VQLIVRGEKYLESSIEPESIDDIRSDSPSNRVSRIQDQHVEAFLMRSTSACQAREACTDHEKINSLWDIPVSHVFISRSSMRGKLGMNLHHV